MKDIFPNPGGSVTVTDEMCDMNGHMNVRFYQTIPMDYEGNFYHSLGFGEDYISRGYSSFTIEQNISYLKECLKGEVLTPRFRMLNVNKKLYHYVCAICKEMMRLLLWWKLLKFTLICRLGNHLKCQMKFSKLWRT